MLFKHAILSVIAVLIISTQAMSTVSFPGALGVGNVSIGGRGGAVIHVTNLNDSGAGSFREALLTQGARTIVFDISGNIDNKTILTVTEPYLTIAGQTSPGGIAISGKQFNIATHDVIIRNMRFRSGGYRYDGNDSDGDSFSLWGPNWNGGTLVYNIMIDHCSMTWGTDETFSITGGATAVTVQNTLIAQGLQYAKSPNTEHSKGLMISGKYNYDTEVSLYRCYLAHSSERVPYMFNPSDDDTNFITEGVNNVIYNPWHGFKASVGGDAKTNWMDNYFKLGPDTTAEDNVYYLMWAGTYLSTEEPLYYMDKNVKTGEQPSTAWSISDGWHMSEMTADYSTTTRWSMDVPLSRTIMTASLASSIVSLSGATVPVRDSVDTIIVNSFDAGTGQFLDTVTYPDDWPTYDTLNDNPADTDLDGMPDAWETANGTSPTVANNNTHTFDADYTDIEYYINTLAGDYSSSPPSTGSPLGGNTLLPFGGNGALIFR